MFLHANLKKQGDSLPFSKSVRQNTPIMNYVDYLGHLEPVLLIIKLLVL
jgi:hypothetical protein